MAGDVVKIYIAQRTWCLYTWGDSARPGSSVREPNLPRAVAEEYWSAWSKDAYNVYLTLKLSTNPYNIEQLASEIDRLWRAKDAMLAAGDDELIDNPALFWKRVGALATTMDAVRGLESRVDTDIEILKGTVHDTVEQAPKFALDAAAAALIATLKALLGPFAPWLVVGGAYFLWRSSR